MDVKSHTSYLGMLNLLGSALWGTCQFPPHIEKRENLPSNHNRLIQTRVEKTDLIKNYSCSCSRVV